MKKLFVNLSAWLMGGMSLLPVPAFAQSPNLDPNQIGAVDIKAIIEGAITWIGGIAGAIAVAYLVYGGIVYITGGAKGAESAKQIIINAIIGMVVILLAYTIAQAVLSLLTSAA